MSKITNKHFENEFESSDKKYMNELDSEFELFVESGHKNIFHVVGQKQGKKKGNYETDPGPPNHVRTSISDSSEEINIPRPPRVYSFEQR